ncbi:MAG: transposase [Planctomycetota bacterium]|jgi:REP element-mobilizing transposase RayT
MVIAYHAIFTTYGTWLPNDPRGSYSKEIYNDQLEALGRIKYGRQNPVPSKDLLMRFWTAATPHLRRPPFFIDDKTRAAIAAGFSSVVQRLGIRMPACAIMNDHVHVLVLRSKYRIEYIVNQLKGTATQALKLKQTPWTRGCWKVFITDTEALRAGVNYIQANPICAGLSAQSWDFITPVSV